MFTGDQRPKLGPLIGAGSKGFIKETKQSFFVLPKKQTPRKKVIQKIELQGSQKVNKAATIQQIIHKVVMLYPCPSLETAGHHQMAAAVAALHVNNH